MALQALQSSGVAFRKILSHFPEELRLAFAYGSGVYRQAGPSSDQKVKIVAMNEDVALRSALDQNLRSAVTAAFLMLPESFAEEDLFMEIAGLSYSGSSLPSPGEKIPNKWRHEQGLERKAEQSDEPLQKEMERKSRFPFAMSVTERDPKTGLPREVTKLTQRVSSMTLEEPMRKRHRLNPYPTWAQVKNMTCQAEQTLKSKRNIIIAPGLIDQALEAFINLKQVSGLIRTYC